jgi:hypothetical protein
MIEHALNNFEKFVIILFIFSVIFGPLGIWKFIEILIWCHNHVSVTFL